MTNSDWYNVQRIKNNIILREYHDTYITKPNIDTYTKKEKT